MKKIIKRFWGLAIVVVLLSSLFVAAPASAGTQMASYAPIPSDPIPSPIGITAIGTVVYDFAVADTNSNVIYAATSDNALKSTDQGRTWAKINNGPAGTSNSTSLVAIAPDNADVVVYVDTAPSLHVRLSLNGGLSFFDLGIPQNNTGAIVPVTVIRDVDISCEFTDLYGYTYRYIGIAGNDGVDARFYYIAFGAYAPYDWYEAVMDWTLGAEYTADNDCFFAVKFSPAFNVDSIAYLLAQNTAALKAIELHVVSFNILTIGGGQFNSNVSGFSWYDPGTGQGTPVYANPGAGAVLKGQIIFDPGYSGVYYSPYARTAYCSVATAANEGGAFQIFEDTSARPVVGTPGMGAYPAGSGVPMVGGAIWSIALNDAGTTLQAAAMATASTFKVTAPWGVFGMGVTPDLPIKEIGGGPGAAFPFGGVSTTGSNMTIFYAGDNVLCSKTGDMSAFSLSRNDGYTWNDISLVNTTMDNINDQAVSADGVERYVVSQGQAYEHTIVATYIALSGVDHTSVFYFDGTYWERVFCRFDANGFVIRNSPVSFGVIYMGDMTTGTIYYTSTYGMDDWRWRLAPLPNTTVADIEVVDDATFYAAVNVGGPPGVGYVCPLIFSGLYWNASDYIQTFGGAAVASISLVSADEVLVGSRTGDVAYTTTGGNIPSEWTVIPAKIGAAGNVYCDSTGLGPFGIIYAVEDTLTAGAVWSWMIGVSTTAWAPVYFAPAPPSYQSVDIMIYGTGTAQCIYYLADNTTDILLARSFLDEAYFSPTGGWLAVTTVTTAGQVPDALKGSADASGILGNKIWFIETTDVDRWPVAMRGFGETIDPVGVAGFPQIIIYTDELAAVAPVLASPIDGYIVQVNKQTGIAYDTVLTWTHAVNSPMAMFVPGFYSYLLQVSLDSTFTTLVINNTPVISPTIIGPWVAAITGNQIVYQPGEIYYWRVRCLTPYFSRWSDTHTLNIQAAPIPVPELYAPANGGVVNTLTPSFSWSPMSGTAVPSGITTTYTYQLGTDPSFDPATSLIYEAAVTDTTGLELPPGLLIDGDVYYWRVCTDTAPHTNWSATAVFTVDLSAGHTTITTTETSTAVPATVGVPSGSATHTDNVVNPSYIWAIIIIGAVLVVAIIVLIFRTRK